MKSGLLTIAILLTLTNTSHAAYEVVNCDSIRGTNHSLSLIYVESTLMQVRIQSINSGRPHTLLPVKINNQNFPGYTLYTVAGTSSILKIENKIQEGNGGLVSFSNDEFSCQ